MSDQPRPRYLLLLEAMPADAPADRRLAQALKHLLRAHRLRCVEVRDARPDTRLAPQTHPETTPDDLYHRRPAP